MWVAQTNSEAGMNSRARNGRFLSPELLPLYPLALPEDLLHLESWTFVLGQARHQGADSPVGRHQGVSPPNLAEFQCSSSSSEQTFLGSGPRWS